MTIFNLYFNYLFERTLPRKQLERHQYQWLDTLCKLECERATIIFLTFHRRIDNRQIFAFVRLEF